MLAVTGQRTPCVVFTLASVEYGLDISHVQEIMRLPEVTPIPNAADYIVGIINLRGSIIPILDLKLRLFGSSTVFNDDTRVIVLEFENKRTGFIVDEVSEVINIPYEQVIMTDTMTEGNYSAYMLGVAQLEKRLLIMLNAQAILDKENQKGGEMDSDTIRDY